MKGTATLAEARAHVAVNLSKGVRCPCCHQMAKEYIRKLNSGMAMALIRMYAIHGLDWQDKTDTLKGFGPAARDESLLRHWGLLEEALISREDGGRAGWWRVTELGRQFVLGRFQVSSHVCLYNNTFLGLHGPLVSIESCIGQGFDLTELMTTRDDDAPHTPTERT